MFCRAVAWRESTEGRKVVNSAYFREEGVNKMGKRGGGDRNSRWFDSPGSRTNVGLMPSPCYPPHCLAHRRVRKSELTAVLCVSRGRFAFASVLGSDRV